MTFTQDSDLVSARLYLAKIQGKLFVFHFGETNEITIFMPYFNHHIFDVLSISKQNVIVLFKITYANQFFFGLFFFCCI